MEIYIIPSDNLLHTTKQWKFGLKIGKGISLLKKSDEFYQK